MVGAGAPAIRDAFHGGFGGYLAMAVATTALMALAFGVLSILAIRWLMVDLGVTGEPAPLLLWMWIGLSGCAVVLAVARWSRSTWPRRRHSLFAT